MVLTKVSGCGRRCCWEEKEQGRESKRGLSTFRRLEKKSRRAKRTKSSIRSVKQLQEVALCVEGVSFR